MFINVRESPFSVPEIDTSKPRQTWTNAHNALQGAIYYVYYNGYQPGTGGGTVYCPGNYYVQGWLHVPPTVNLVGSYQCVPKHWGPQGEDGTGIQKLFAGGTHFLLDAAGAAESIWVENAASLRGAVLHHVGLRDKNVVAPQPWAVRTAGLVENVELHPVWDGIKVEGWGVVRGVWGQALNTGVLIDEGHGGNIISDVNLPQCWTGYDTQQGSYQKANGVLFKVVYSDGFNFLGCAGRGPKVGWLIEPRVINGVEMLATGFLSLCGCEVEGPDSAALLLRGGQGNLPVNVSQTALNAEGVCVKTEKYKAEVNLEKCYHYGNKGKLARVDGGKVYMAKPSIYLDGDPAIEAVSGVLEVEDPRLADGLNLNAVYHPGATLNVTNVKGGNLVVKGV